MPRPRDIKARKTYVCDGCGDSITPGDFYQKGIVHYGYGDKETLRYCHRCK